MKNRKLTLITLLLYGVSIFGQIQFINKTNTINVCETITTSLFIKGVDKPTLDIGNDNVIAEIQEISSNYYYIKLKAVKPFIKTSMIIISKTPLDFPVLEIVYDKNMSIGKYIIDINNFNEASSISTKKEKVIITEDIPTINTINQNRNDENSIKTSTTIQEQEINNNISNLNEIQTKQIVEDKYIANTKKFNLKKDDKWQTYEMLFSSKNVITGKTNNMYHIKLTNLVSTKKSLIFVINILNRGGGDINIDDISMLLKKNIKGREMSEPIEDIIYVGASSIKSKEEKNIYIETSSIVLDKLESLQLCLNEKKEYGMGRNICLEINQKHFEKLIKNY